MRVGSSLEVYMYFPSSVQSRLDLIHEAGKFVLWQVDRPKLQ